jgi:hypothetical protein
MTASSTTVECVIQKIVFGLFMTNVVKFVGVFNSVLLVLVSKAMIYL